MTKIEMHTQDEQRNEFVSEKMRERFVLGIGDSELGSGYFLYSLFTTGDVERFIDPTVQEDRSIDIR